MPSSTTETIVGSAAQSIQSAPACLFFKKQKKEIMVKKKRNYGEVRGAVYTICPSLLFLKRKEKKLWWKKKRNYGGVRGAVYTSLFISQKKKRLRDTAYKRWWKANKQRERKRN